MDLGIVLGLVTPVLEHTIGPVIRHAGYAFCYSRKAAELNNQVDKLAIARECLQKLVEEAEMTGNDILPKVEKWLTDAENAIKEAGKVTQRKEEEAKKKCFAGGCPNLWTRYQLGKKAAKDALAIAALEKDCPDRSQIPYRASPQQIVSSSVHGFEGLPSRASTFQEVMDALSDPNVNRIGVHGMGGTGKTTLANEVHKQAIERNLFDFVASVTVSEKREPRDIQGRIADALGLKLDKETVEGRADQLHQQLMKKKTVLIILDDLREKIELLQVGIPSTNGKSIKGRGADSVREVIQFNSQLETIGRNENYLKECKLLMISRNRQLLTNDMGVQKEVVLNVLTEEESFTLFERTVDGRKIPSLQPIAKEVARKCAGLPLLLVTIASALKDKELEEWKDASNRLSTFEDEEIQKKVYTCLEWSYDYLPTEEVKSFFLLCGLFSYSHILILDLLKYSMGLGLLEHVHTVEDARIRVHQLIGKLKASNLLLDSETDGFVKIHDVVQDVAASIASRIQLAFKKVGGEMEEFKRNDTTSYARIYLVNCDVSMLNLKWQCPAVEFFHLKAEGLSLKIPDSFFEGITKLQVLNFTGMHFSSLPPSLDSLTSLCTLCLDLCELKDISIIRQLKNLEILSLAGSEIVDLPRDLTELTRLKLLDLSYCTKLEFIPENVLSRLSRLEELLLRNSFANWEIKQLDGQTNASLSELERLSLTNLEIHVPDAKKLPKSMSSKKLERYNILIGDTWDWDDKYQASRTLKLKLDTSIHSKHGLKILLNDVEDLFLDEVKGITNILFELHSEGFPQLKHLHVRNGGEILHIVDKRWVACAAFPALESLILHNLVNLSKISREKLLDEDLRKLRILKVRRCNGLKNLFPLSMVGRNLRQLGEMEIMDCSDMEAIFADENEEEIEEDDDKNEVLEFAQLYSLKLRLPLLRSFCSRGKVSPASTSTSRSRQKQYAMDPSLMEIESACDTSLSLFNEMIVFPNLQELELSSIGVDKIWHGQFADRHSFCKLTILTVEACKNLNYLCTTSIVKSLAQLQKLEIRDCSSMEDVIATDGEKLDETTFPNLESLKLRGLPKLSRFCIGGSIEFPSLKELWIEDCVELKAFISNPVAVNTRSNLALFDEKVLFPKLEELRIVNMDELEMIWHNELHESSFCKLKSLIVKHAEKLLNIFPSNMLLSKFLNLENLRLNDCPLLEEVFNRQLQELINFRIQRLTASRLKTMTIKNLPNLKHIWKKDPHEREIISFDNLQEVVAYQCPNLKSIFPAFIARGLLQLESLQLGSCGIEDIVERDEETEAIARFEFPKLTTLTLYDLTKLKTVCSGIRTFEWPMLKRLFVSGCPNMQVFTSESENVQETCRESQLDNPLQQPFFSIEKVIPNLEVLSLTCKDAQMIRDAPFPTHFFDKVSHLILEDLDKKSASYLSALLRRFHNLEELDIYCIWLEEMFSCEGSVNGENQGSIVPRIRRMKLHMLYNMKIIWRRDCQMEHMLEDLEILQVFGCDSLLNLAPTVACLGNLSHLDVWKCKGLLNMVTSSTVKYMGRLTKLSIRECEMVEEIVAREEDDREGQITWGNLKILELHCLASLTCFSSAHHTFQFPCLEEVIVTQCPKLKAFSGGVSITPKLKRVKLTEEDAEGRWKGDLNTTIQQLSAELVGLHGREHLNLSDFPELKETWHKEHFPANCLSDLRSLVVDECVSYSHAVPSNLLRSLDKLAELEVKNCDSVEEVFDLTLPYAADGQIETLPKLDKLQLIDLPKLNQIWKEEPQGVFQLRNLKVLKIHNCSTLRYLFTPATCLGLGRLRELEVKSCPLIEEIITKGAASGATVDNVMLPRLNSVSLECLPNLISFYSGGGSVQCPSLKMIVVIECSSTFTFTFFNDTQRKNVFTNLQELKLSSISVPKIWHGQFADRHSFCKLTSLIVEACRNLNYLCTTSIVKSLAQLQKLEIRDCESMEDVIATEGEQLDESAFPNLEFLKLKGLPKLSRFCVGGSIEFSSLKELWIEDCVELRAFISSPVAVNTRSNLALFDEKIIFPKLEELHIANMNELKMIWHDEVVESSFCKLKSVIVEHTEKLLNIFPSNMLMNMLLNLENLQLNDCPLLEEVFNLQPQALINCRIQGERATQLKEMTMENLPNLKHIWKKHPNEREIIFFNNLQEVKVIGCLNLKSIFPAFIARGLKQLESLVLIVCGIEEIVERDEETEAIARFEFPKLTTLTLYGLRELKTVYPGMHTSEWPMLKILDILDCPNMQVFTSESGSVQETCRRIQLDNPLQQPSFLVEKVIPNLEQLSLTCKDAQMIRDAQFPAHVFDKVRLLRLTELDKKLASFLFALLRRFHNLEELYITGNRLEEMFSCEGSVNGENQGSIVPRIRRMTLNLLYNMRSIWRRDCQMEHMLEDLEILNIFQCDSLLSLAPSVACFGNLFYLDVWECSGLLNLVTSSTVKYMGRLTKLSIRECEMVEEIVAREEDDTEGQIAWGNLTILELHCLASLTCFSSAHHTFQFPCLEEVIVTQCPKLKAFSGGVSITPKLKRVKLTEEDAEGRWKGDLNTTIQHLSAELVGLHGREHLKLSDFPDLKETWHKEHFPANCLSDLRSLVVDECVSYSHAVPSNLLRSLDKLAELEVKNCDSVEEVFDLSLPYAADGQIETLPKLDKLQLIDLPKLNQIWKEEPQGVFQLRNLKVLKIHNCSTLRYLFTPTTCLGLVRLRELEVKSCPLIEEIVTKRAASGATVDNVMFPRLNSVSLESLPNLSSFYSGSGAVQCPLLKSIAIIECSSTFSSAFLNGHPTFNTNGAIQAKVVFPNLEELKLSSIRVENMWWGQFVDRSSLFSRLTNLAVEGCGNLNYLLSPSAVKSLSQLQKLEICDCEIMEEIVLAEGDILRKIFFPKLEFLRLKGLPKLLRFCIGDLIEFPCLKELWIENCVELKTFISNHFTTSTAAILALFDRKVVLPMLKTLQVLNLDRLKMIWHNELHKESFCKLKNLTIKHCGELSKIFPSIMLTRFQDLEQLDVEETHAETVTQLRTVHLGNLPNLKHIWVENSQRNISFQSLRLAHVWDCPVLKSIFPASVAEVLLQLEDLNIDSCGVEEIVAAEEGEGKESQITRFMFPKLNSLTLWKLSKLDKFYPGIHTTEWPALKTLNVKECDKMKIFSFESQSLQGPWEEGQPDIQVPQPLFSFQEVTPGLEELSLNNEDAAIIWKSQFPANLFDKLEALQLNCFHDKSTVFPFEILHRFHNVEKLIVACSQFKELFASEEHFEKEEHKMALSQIRHLKLDCLPNLEHIWNQEPQLDYVLPSLKAVEVFNCDNLRNLAPSFTSFQSLTTLEMKKCHGLINIVASSTAKTLVQLKTMRIIECNMVREIVASDGGKTDEEIMFRRLVTLELNCLPSLASFCSANHSFKFPSLTKVIVSQCPKMEFFSKVALSTPKLERVERTEDDHKGCWHRNLNVTIQQFFV